MTNIPQDDWYFQPRRDETGRQADDPVGRDDEAASPPPPTDKYADLDDLLKSFTPPPPRNPDAPARTGRARQRAAARNTKTMAVPVGSVPANPTAGHEKTPTNRQAAFNRRFVDVRGLLTGLRQRTGSVRARPSKKPIVSRADENTPRLNFRISRVGLYVIGSVIFIAAIVFGLGRLRNDPALTFPNAIWIGTEWTYETRTDDEVTGLAAQLRQHQIGTVYAWVSWLQADNTWRGQDNFPRVQEFVRQFKAAYPDAELLGWISLPVEGTGIPYRLDSIDVQMQMADFAARVINEFGFDGVFLNVEPVWNEDENFLALLRAVRARLGSDVTISAAIPPDWSPVGVDIPVPPLIVPGTVWSEAYKQSVALLIDELAVMAYNSGLSDPGDYTRWMAYQVEAFGRAVAEMGIGTEIVIGIPTYDAEPPGHDPLVENVASASAGVIAGLEALGDEAFPVRGTALYAGWTTDDVEWLEYLRSWVQR